MAATYAVRPSGVGSVHAEKIPGSFFDALIEITADNSYPTGGYAFGITQLQSLFGGSYSAIESVEVVNQWGTDAGATAFLARFDRTNNKVQAFGMAAAAGVSTGFTEVANTNANVNGMKCTLRVRFY